MGQQPPHRNGFLAGPGEPGPVAGHRGVQVDHLPVGEHADGDGEDALGDRHERLQCPPGVGAAAARVRHAGGALYHGLARAATDPPFSQDDISFVARACEPVARGLRLSHLLAGDRPADPAPPGMLVLDDDEGVISQTDAARDWLAQLPADQARGLDLPAAILSAAWALGPAHPGNGVAGGRLRTATGRWLRLHAARLAPAGAQGSGQVAVILEPVRPADLSPLVLDLHGLTDRERQITQLLLRGLPTTEIAETLFISRHTLGDHVKAIFAKLGVSSRPELTALLLDHAPAAPGPGR